MDNSSITLADTGLGTTFERWALNRVLMRIKETYHIQSALEGPGDGITGIVGINSIILARDGVRVTLHLPDSNQVAYAQRVWQIHAPNASPQFITDVSASIPDCSYDLVWNFNILPCAFDPGSLLAEMARVSRYTVFFCVPNAGNYSFWLRHLHHKITRQPWDSCPIGWMRPDPWLNLLPKNGLHLREAFYLDCPWWPDIVDLGKLVEDFFPFLKNVAHRAKPENRYKWKPEALPYYDPASYPEIHQHMERLAYFENSPFQSLKRMFGHHLGIVATKS